MRLTRIQRESNTRPLILSRVKIFNSLKKKILGGRLCVCGCVCVCVCVCGGVLVCCGCVWVVCGVCVCGGGGGSVHVYVCWCIALMEVGKIYNLSPLVI